MFDGGAVRCRRVFLPSYCWGDSVTYFFLGTGLFLLCIVGLLVLAVLAQDYSKMNESIDRIERWIINAREKLDNMEASGTVLDDEDRDLLGKDMEFSGEDSYYRGRVVAVFGKRNQQKVRVVVENNDGLLLIKNPYSQNARIVGEH